METTMREPVEVYFPEPTNLEFDQPSQANESWNDDPLAAKDEYHDELMEEKFQPIVNLIEGEKFPSNEENSSNFVVQLNDSLISPVPVNLTEDEMDLEERQVRIKNEIVDKSYEIFKPHEYNFKVEDESCEEYLMELFDDPIHSDAHGSEDCEIVSSKLNDLDDEVQRDSLKTDDNGFKLIASLKSSIQNRFRELSFPKSQSESLPLRTTVDEMLPFVPPTVYKEGTIIETNLSRLENSSTGTKFLTINTNDLKPTRKEVVIDTFTVTTIEPNSSRLENSSTSTKFPTISTIDMEPKRRRVVTDTCAPKGGDMSSDINVNMKIPFTCHVCKKGFLQMNDFVFHIQQHKIESNSKAPFTCNFCWRKFRVKYGLFKHIAMIHKPKPKQKELKAPFTCKICNKGFFEELDSISHEFEHRQLDARLTDMHNMINPVVKKPKNGMNFVCKQCTRRFSKKKELVVHMRLHDSSPKSMHTCKSCPYQFSTNGGLKLHYTFSHKNNPNYKFLHKV